MVPAALSAVDVHGDVDLVGGRGSAAEEPPGTTAFSRRPSRHAAAVRLDELSAG